LRARLVLPLIGALASAERHVVRPMKEQALTSFGWTGYKEDVFMAVGCACLCCCCNTPQARILVFAMTT
jgi:hypothetical protein